MKFDRCPLLLEIVALLGVAASPRRSLENTFAHLGRIGAFVPCVVIGRDDKEVGRVRLKSCRNVTGYVSLECCNRRSIASRCCCPIDFVSYQVALGVGIPSQGRRRAGV